MSIEVRWPVGEDGACVTTLGEIVHPCPRPDRGEVGHLMLVARQYVDELLAGGPRVAPSGCGVHAVTECGGRLFAHHEYHGQRWTWELFDAHWQDRGGPELFVGRWPD